jgi:hypothetical protein
MDDFAELQALLGRGGRLSGAEASRVQTLMAAAGARAKAGGSEVAAAFRSGFLLFFLSFCLSYDTHIPSTILTNVTSLLFRPHL